jgi:hypothetical protein
VTVGLILDTTALVAYMNGSINVGTRIAEAADEGYDVLVPALCLAQAHRDADATSFRWLGVLADVGNVQVVPLERRRCSIVGSWSRALGTLDLAHVAVEAAANPIVPIVTTRGHLLRTVLPAAWPIIEP